MPVQRIDWSQGTVRQEAVAVMEGRFVKSWCERSQGEDRDLKAKLDSMGPE